MPEPECDFNEAVWSPSPNHGERADGRAPDMLLLHYTGMASGTDALSRLRSSESDVSAHYVVFEDGTIHQLVAETRRAWHAGKSLWAGEHDINSCSIGIEIVNPGHDGGLPPFADAQIAAVVALCRDCRKRWSVPGERVLAHSDVAPSRKCDPGERFPWSVLAENGVGHWVEPSAMRSGRYFQAGESGQPIEALQSMLSLYGYGVEPDGHFGARTEAVVTAFQRHFRPERVDGVADAGTIDTLHRLLSTLPRFATR
ncbi:N-acetylmuramoyl-L-alanine amidase [Pararhizobium mangrovi]|uniref:N-acetylmuramoyl-L-alanine amidase n=1 Tax=Pararhizobium mangrovi TaxID=2590452 RepID=A0A506U864_9HYPH|nr:N-acetylmuramoyl-L-alanine amidase [Pararhizobium mangrovi]TPW29284.1 N-acetylmuramoyl-L-alanine amidase [Pararhizobium mangrovi]